MNRTSECTEPIKSTAHTAVKVVVAGRVQGVGFRPAVARLANELSLAGQVRNTGSGVEILVEGLSAAIDRFLQRLRIDAPSLAQVANFEVCQIHPAGRKRFEIAKGIAAGPLQTAIPLDLAVCSECLADTQSLDDSRAGYPFTSCTNCGPRYSILRSLPYERSATTMSAFELCGSCTAEYERPADRRFHAETIACPVCGPKCWLSTANGQVVGTAGDAIVAVRTALRQGKIVALRGIGGYQLLVDATNQPAVARLRSKKRRPARPLAVMVESLAQAREIGCMNVPVERALSDPAGPIVVVPCRKNTLIAPEVCCGLAEVGIVLPTSPLHWLIAHDCPPLIATSGNLESRPLENEIDDANKKLEDVTDLFLHHDRPIFRPIDDSVIKIVGGKPVTLRAGRGIAPLPLRLESERHQERHCILALGGQQNNAVAVWNGYQAVLGPHVGDLDEIATCERWHSHRHDFCQLLGAEPSLVVHDLHPDYYTSRWATESGLPTIAVQHHHAHVAAAMLEHDWLDREVLGVAWDGTGYGPDGTIWGGEFLKATVAGYQRVARLRPFALPGGEAAIREPWRIALAVLAEVYGAAEAIGFLSSRGWKPEVLAQALDIISRPHLSPRTSSIGRLFDAVATIALPYDVTTGGQSSFEGQLAMLLESACECHNTDEAVASKPAVYSLPLIDGDPDELDWRPLLLAVVADCQRDQAPTAIARRFHAALAKAITAVSDKYKKLPVALCGGVFQNRVLTEMTLREFDSRPQSVGTPGVIPPGDGGLAAGQLAIALARLGSAPTPLH